MTAEPDDDYLFDDEPDEEDEDDLLLDECGMTPGGDCQLAGTEWCDWTCPLSRAHAAARIKAMKAKQP